jgi:hypothetical protein
MVALTGPASFPFPQTFQLARMFKKTLKIQYFLQESAFIIYDPPERNQVRNARRPSDVPENLISARVSALSAKIAKSP